MTRWASAPNDMSAEAFLRSVEAQGSVSLIATPWASVKTEIARDWRSIEHDPAMADFDQVPLISPKDAKIEAIYIRGRGRVFLDSGMFMAADAPLIAFVEDADRQRFRLLLSGNEIIGLVTLSDLQKLPVYALIFGMVIAAELLLMDSIRQKCRQNPDHWLTYLSKHQRDRIERYWEQAVGHNTAIDRVSYASLTDEIRVALHLGMFERNGVIHQQLQDLVPLRNKVCHAMEVAPNPEQAMRISASVRDALSLIRQLQSLSGVIS